MSPLSRALAREQAATKREFVRDLDEVIARARRRVQALLDAKAGKRPLKVVTVTSYKVSGYTMPTHHRVLVGRARSS